MTLTFVDYVIEPTSSGSPNVVHIPSAVLGIILDGVAFDNLAWTVYTSFDGVTIHELDGLTVDLVADLFWVPPNNTDWYRLRCAGPYFAIDSLDESLQHNIKLVCRGVT